MKWLSGSCAIITLMIGLISVPAVIAEDAAPQGEGRYLVKFRTFQGAANATKSAGGRVARELAQQKVVAVYLSDQALRLLRNNPNVEYVEVDPRRYPLAQSKPYGIGMVQADHPDLAASNASAGATVCIIDSGYYQAHEDLQDANVTGSNDSGTGNWFEDSCGHGTHVAGTVSALDNAVGVVGVNGNGLLQMHIEKVFDGASCGWSYSSDLIAALNRCQDAVAGTGQRLVVNMSLAGSEPSAAEEAAFQGAYDSNVLPIAAAGNGGGTSIVYPAGYASVVSVAAVDSNGTAASFSQRNTDVELAAPGVGVVSTTPFNGTRLVVGANVWFGTSLIGSVRIDAAGILADGGLCDTIGTWNGNVVLCRRGSVSFAQKVANVTAGGGVGAAIYNNVSGGFTGTLNGASTIPAISLSLADGQAALAYVDSESSLVNSEGVGNGYEPYDGTSMATPHVSGVAALLWSFYPTKTNAEIRNALQETALDKGTAGRDNTYGYGIVQAKVAYDYLAGILPPPPPPPPATSISLTVTKVKSGGKRYARLRWNGATGSKVNYYRNTTKYTTANDGTQRNGPLALGTYTYKVCNLNTTNCSGNVTITY
jgi:subtilisin family serine protease